MCKVMNVRVELAVINLGQNKKKKMWRKNVEKVYVFIFLFFAR